MQERRNPDFAADLRAWLSEIDTSALNAGLMFGGVSFGSPPARREGLGEGLSRDGASPAASAAAQAGPHPASPASGGGDLRR